MSKTLQRSVLAAAISVAAMQAVADIDTDLVVQMAGAVPVSSVDGEFKSITIEGEFEGTEDAFSLEAPTVDGDIVNNANITVVSSEAFAAALDLSENEEGDRASVAGSFINNGDIRVEGDDGAGIVIESTDFAGSIRNTGNVSVLAGLTDEGARALMISDIETVGSIENTGTLSLEAEDSVTLEVARSIVEGALNNSGSIIAVGDDSPALHVIESEIDGGFINSGTISATGNNVTAADFDLNAVIGEFTNTGTITAEGEASMAVLIDGATVDTITNTGTIAGGNVGRAIDQVYPTEISANPELHINHNGGLIAGKDYAVIGSDAVASILNWNAGEIQGDLQSLFQVNVNGDVDFDGGVIQAHDFVMVSKDAVLNLMQSQTSVLGDLTLEEGGAVGLTLSPSVDESTPVLLVEGVATFADGSKVLVAADTKDFLGEGREFVLIKADTLIDSGVDLESQSLALNLTRLEGGDDENAIAVHVQTKDRSAMMAEIASAGGNVNAQAAGAEFVQLMSDVAATHGDDAVFQAMMGASTGAELANLSKQLSPDASGAASQAARSTQSLSSNAVANRSSNLRSGMSSGVDLSKTGVWARGLKSSAEQDMRDGIDGYDADAVGVLIGADAQITPELTAGAYFGQTKTDVKSDIGNKVDADNNIVGLYTTWNRDGVFVDTNLSYGVGDNESKRFIAGTTAEGSYDSKMLGLSITAGNTYDVEGLQVEPRVSARYSKLEIDGYTETGSLAALSVGDQRLEVGELGAGLRVSGQVAFAGGILEPEASFMAYHDLIQDEANSTAAFVVGGNTFVSSGADAVKNSYEAGVGATYRRGNLSFNVSYDRLTKADYSADVVGAKVRLDF